MSTESLLVVLASVGLVVFLHARTNRRLLRELAPLLQDARTRLGRVEGRLHGVETHVRWRWDSRPGSDETEVKLHLASPNCTIELKAIRHPKAAERFDARPLTDDDAFDRNFVVFGSPEALLTKFFDAELRAELLATTIKTVDVRDGWITCTCREHRAGEELRALLQFVARFRAHILATFKGETVAAAERAQPLQAGIYRPVPPAPVNVWKDEVAAFQSRRWKAEWIFTAFVLIGVLGLVGFGFLVKRLLS